MDNNQYNLNGIDVVFPFQAYPCQLDYMRKVIQSLQERKNALLESPTGTGKTLCLLCSIMSWRHKEYTYNKDNSENINNEKLHIPKIIYSSRTHSQLRHCLHELNRTMFSKKKVALLGSRLQLCINKVLSNPPSSDIEDILNFCRNEKICPFFYCRDQIKDSDIIFLPYNYLLNTDIRYTLKDVISWENDIIIFDEAHNIPDVSQAASSITLYASNIALCIEEIQIVLSIIPLLEPSMEKDILNDSLLFCKKNLLLFEEKISKIEYHQNSNEITFPGTHLLEWLYQCNITERKALDIIIPSFNKSIELLSANPIHLSKVKKAFRNRIDLHIFLVFLIRLYTQKLTRATIERCYIVHVSSEPIDFNDPYSKSQRIVNFFCLDPGYSLKFFSESKVRCILMTSGTLSPLNAFENEMKIPFPIQLENPHVVSKYQISVNIISHGPSNILLNSSYSNRSNTNYILEIGNTIINISRIINGGILVFFPSYSFMKTCIDNWKDGSPSVIDRIQRNKYVVIETPSNGNQLIKNIKEYYEKLDDSSYKGSLFMAICRGKVSEGLDFSDNSGRAVIIVGVPYPNFNDWKIQNKKIYLDKLSKNNLSPLGGAQWYQQQASRAVNQSIGRIIRHKDDYGVIILCDERFSEQSLMKELSFWIRDQIQVHHNFGMINQQIYQFFSNISFLYPSKNISFEKHSNSSIDKMVEFYEDEKYNNNESSSSHESSLNSRPTSQLSGDKNNHQKKNIHFLTSLSPPTSLKKRAIDSKKINEKDSSQIQFFLARNNIFLTENEYKETKKYLAMFQQKKRILKSLQNPLLDYFDESFNGLFSIWSIDIKRHELVQLFQSFVPPLFHNHYDLLWKEFIQKPQTNNSIEEKDHNNINIPDHLHNEINSSEPTLRQFISKVHKVMSPDQFKEFQRICQQLLQIKHKSNSPYPQEIRTLFNQLYQIFKDYPWIIEQFEPLLPQNLLSIYQEIMNGVNHEFTSLTSFKQYLTQSFSAEDISTFSILLKQVVQLKSSSSPSDFALLSELNIETPFCFNINRSLFHISQLLTKIPRSDLLSIFSRFLPENIKSIWDEIIQNSK